MELKLGAPQAGDLRQSGRPPRQPGSHKTAGQAPRLRLQSQTEGPSLGPSGPSRVDKSQNLTSSLDRNRTEASCRMGNWSTSVTVCKSRNSGAVAAVATVGNAETSIEPKTHAVGEVAADKATISSKILPQAGQEDGSTFNEERDRILADMCIGRQRVNWSRGEKSVMRSFNSQLGTSFSAEQLRSRWAYLKNSNRNKTGTTNSEISRGDEKHREEDRTAGMPHSAETNRATAKSKAADHKRATETDKATHIHRAAVTNNAAETNKATQTSIATETARATQAHTATTTNRTTEAKRTTQTAAEDNRTTPPHRATVTDGATEAERTTATDITTLPDRVLYTLCKDLAKVDWKHRVLDIFRRATGLDWTADKARRRWYEIKAQGLRFQPVDLSGIVAPTGATRANESQDEAQDDEPQRETSTEQDQSTEIVATTSGAAVVSGSAGTVRDTVATAEDWERIFLPTFREALRYSSRIFNRRPLPRPKGKIPPSLLAFASRTVDATMEERPAGISEVSFLNSVVYAAAVSVVEALKLKNTANPSILSERYWFEKKLAEIAKLERILHLIDCELRRRRRGGLPNKEQRLRRKELFSLIRERRTSCIQRLQTELEHRLSIAKDRVNVRREEKQRKLLRKLFAKCPSLKVLEQRQSGEGGLEMDKVEAYWRPLIGEALGKGKADFERNEALGNWRNECFAAYRDVGWTEQDLGERFDSVVGKTRSWKAAGPDGLQAFWWKSIDAARTRWKRLVIEIIQGKRQPLHWMTRGRTVLVYKSGSPQDPANYRPITCLNTCYKLMTGVLNEMIARHIQGGPAFPTEQRALRAGEWNCLHASLLDRHIALDAKLGKAEVHMAWVDFRKAFDSLGHEYLRWVLECIRVPLSVRCLLGKLMSHWRTSFVVGKHKTHAIEIKRGVFQGDALSPTLFAIAISPLSLALRVESLRYATTCGQAAGTPLVLNHQFYMDDLKCYARSDVALARMLSVVHQLGDLVGVSFNPSKSRYFAIGSGSGRELTVNEKLSIAQLEDTESYKYLGCHQRLSYTTDGVDKLFREVLRKTAVIVAANITANQKRAAFSSIVVPALGYFYMLTSGGSDKLVSALHQADRFDVSIRKLLVDNKVISKPSCIARLYLSVEYGGLGWRSIRDELEDRIVSSFAYLISKVELRTTSRYFHSLLGRSKRSVVSDALKILDSYNVGFEASDDGVRVEGGEPINQARELKRLLVGKLRAKRDSMRLAEWSKKTLAGKVLRIPDLSVPESFAWLRLGHLSSTNARNALVAQEGCLRVRAAPITLGEGSTAVDCRWCRAEAETVSHVVSRCEQWRGNLYLDRHNRVARCIHFWLCQKYKIQPVHYSQAVPARMSGDQVEIFWDTTIQTLAVMDHRKPDIVVIDRQVKRIWLIEVAVAWMSNIKKQIEIKKNRYTVNSLRQEDEARVPYEEGPNLREDVELRYNMPTKFLPVVIGTQGEILKETCEALRELPGFRACDYEPLLGRLTRAAVLGTSRVIKHHLAK